MNFPSFRLACHWWDSEKWRAQGISSSSSWEIFR